MLNIPKNFKKYIFLYLFITLIKITYSSNNYNKEDNLKFLNDNFLKTEEKNNKKNIIEDIAKKIIIDSLPDLKNNTLIKIITKETSDGIYKLNITEETINTVLLIAQRSFAINLQVKNDSSLPLPIGIDTASLSILIPELSEYYPENTNMTITIYESPSYCKRPILDFAIDGVYLDFDLGLKFSIFNSETLQYDEILDFIISTEIKSTIFTENNKLTIFIMKASISELKFNNNVFNLKAENIQERLNGFFRVLISQTRAMLTNIDILNILNTLTGLNFTSFDFTVNVGNAIITIS
jgi:hypothetical protein